jgi:hypothetical protein
MWLNDDRLVVGTDTSDLLLIEGQDIRAVRPLWFVRLVGLFVCFGSAPPHIAAPTP